MADYQTPWDIIYYHLGGPHGRDHMVVVFITTYAISADHH